MQKPYRGDYIADVEKWKKRLKENHKEQRVSVNWGGGCSAVL